jgi:hypothetical protein
MPNYTQSFDIEFNDSLLSYQGYTNPRYEGSKLKAKEINVYVDPSKNPSVPVGTFPQSGPATGSAFFRGWGGDISYGKNPVIENHITAIFVSQTLTTGKEDNKLVDVTGHSYVTIDHILLINTLTDEVQLLNTENVEPEAFKRMVVNNFPEGTSCRFKLLSDIQHLLKKSYNVKFNEGFLMRVYTYTPNTGSSGTEDGVFGGFGLKHHADARSGAGVTGSNIAGYADNLAKTDGLNPGSAGDPTSSGSYTNNPGGGLFGFGMSFHKSQSLFNTNSIDFVSVFPEELEEYENLVNLEIAGEILTVISSSYTPSSFISELAGNKT